MAITKAARNNAYIGLYKAVAKYVQLQGGKVIVCGGIQIQEWHTDRTLGFTVGIKCVGKKPEFVKQQ